MKQIYVQAQPDHIESLSKSAPIAAIEELVWNALDADAREVKVDLLTNPLGAVESVRVSDDGTGIDATKADATFGSLGGSWKRSATQTESAGRRLHGRHGRGRFKAFALGTHVEWRTTTRGEKGALVSYVLSGDLSTPGVFDLDEVAKAGPATGTAVFVAGVRATVDSLTRPEMVVQTLAAKFALYLKAYPGVSVYFCGLPVSPVIVQKGTTDYTVHLESGQEAKLEVIEWRKKFSGKGRIVFCGRDGFTLYERPSGVRSGQPFSYTAYLVGARFGELAAENALVMDELHPEVRAWLDATRAILKEHFHRRAEEAAQERLRRWIDEKIYPFAPDDASEARAAFDAGVAEMRAQLDGFDSLSVAERGYLFSLIRKAVG